MLFSLAIPDAARGSRVASVRRGEAAPDLAVESERVAAALAVGDGVLDPSALLEGFGSFPSSDLLEASCNWLDAVTPGVRDRRHVVTHRLGSREVAQYEYGFATDSEGPTFSVEVGPGLVQLRARDLAKRERVLARHRRPIYSDRQRESRREVEVWSRRSRANLVRVISGADWRPMLERGLPVMVTLTYPGQWLMFAPDGATSKAHFDSFRRRYDRRYGAIVGVWKLEFQRRGAPHLHALLPLPRGESLTSFRDWVARVWNEILRAYSRSIPSPWSPAFIEAQLDAGRKAGTAVDLREGLRCRDPRRIAVYFLKHSSKSMDGKEYQNRVPDAWRQPGKGPGRFWGMWGIERPTAVRYVTPRQYVLLRRTLRRWARAQGRAVCVSGRLQGGWVSVNDGPSFLADLARALSLDGEG